MEEEPVPSLEAAISTINGYLKPFELGFSHVIRPTKARFRMYSLPGEVKEPGKLIRKAILADLEGREKEAPNNFRRSPRDYTHESYKRDEWEGEEIENWKQGLYAFFREVVSFYVWELDDSWYNGVYRDSYAIYLGHLIDIDLARALGATDDIKIYRSSSARQNRYNEMLKRRFGRDLFIVVGERMFHLYFEW